MLGMRKIIHIDMDCFYAAVEMRDHHKYRDQPIAVGFDGPRSVLCTCNYLARQFGVRSAMPVIQAKKLCPQLCVVPVRMEVYKAVSKQLMEIFKRYTLQIEPLSLDEAYLDVTDSNMCNGSATLIAQHIRQAIFDELQLTASAGVAPNKFLAKIASDEQKPNGQFVLPPEQVAQFIQQLPLKKIPGIGPKTAAKLAKQGLLSCADVQQFSADKLHVIMGNASYTLIERSFGRDTRPVIVDRQRKSVAAETTLAQDIVSYQQCASVLTDLLATLYRRLGKISKSKVIKQGIKLKFADFNQTTVEMSVTAINDALFFDLLKKALTRANHRKVRLIGIMLGIQPYVNTLKEQQLNLPLK